MALASWSTKRVVALWAVGLALEALILLAPVLIAHELFASMADLRRSVAEYQARASTSELADSISLAKQKDDARANGTYSITPAGDTVFALVHIPLDRPSRSATPLAIVRGRARITYVGVIILGFIPTILIVLTLCWADARRNDGGGRLASNGA